MRWIGWIGVRDAERDLCGVEHMEHAQGYVPTATENGKAGRGDIHTNAIDSFTNAIVKKAVYINGKAVSRTVL